MRAMRARGFKGYGDLELVELPKPEVSEGKVLVRMTAAGVTPLELRELGPRGVLTRFLRGRTRSRA